jgi:hypothetical protein
MTLAIGVKTFEGAILATDCQAKDAFGKGEKSLVQKIYFGTLKNGGMGVEEESQAYVAFAGTLVPKRFKGNLRRILGKKVEALRGNSTKESLDKLRTLVPKYEGSVRCLFPRDELILRLLNEGNSDMFLVDGERAREVSLVEDFAVMGFGRLLVEGYLQKNLAGRVLTSGEALPVVYEVFNRVLVGNPNFRGYHFVDVRKEGNGHRIRTAYKPGAHKVIKENIPWRSLPSLVFS